MQVAPAPVVNPASAIYIGNSFFYYNNSMHGHCSDLIRGAEAGPPHRAARR